MEECTLTHSLYSKKKEENNCFQNYFNRHAHNPLVYCLKKNKERKMQKSRGNIEALKVDV